VIHLTIEPVVGEVEVRQLKFPDQISHRRHPPLDPLPPR
jgi:hypothetical protein